MAQPEYELFINGEYTPAASAKTLTSVNPATEEPVASVAAGGERDINTAVGSARSAFEDWRIMDPAERGRLLSTLAGRIRDEKDRLAKLETCDNGKPLSQSRSDVEGCARYFEYYAGIADKIQGETIPLSGDYVDYTLKEPLGVTGQIIPWNLPINIFGRSVAPALAAGNVCVVKPAEQTPLTAVELAGLAAEVGFPEGVLNVVPGLGETAGAALSSHPDVDGLSFTGSVATGKQVAKSAAEHVTPVHLELGGKSPGVVFEDADLETAVESIITGIFATNAGQVCSASSRALVHESLHEEFIDELLGRVAKLEVGPGMEDSDIGPLVSSEQLKRVRNYLELGYDEVGDPVIGGEVPDRTGYFVDPTVFDGVDIDTRVCQEEIFGPVLTVSTFTEEREAIKMANDVDYGLVAGVFTNNVARAHRFARDIKAGQIFVNEWFAGGVETPFGGFKQSGFGREKGLEAIEAYTQTKNVCANISLK
jgi:acyl-CoA reductase-like NAD-dependent aldehyde dehydrogenase